jgi:hypothetical protein
MRPGGGNDHPSPETTAPGRTEDPREQHPIGLDQRAQGDGVGPSLVAQVALRGAVVELKPRYAAA